MQSCTTSCRISSNLLATSKQGGRPLKFVVEVLRHANGRDPKDSDEACHEKLVLADFVPCIVAMHHRAVAYDWEMVMTQRRISRYL